ncbi:carbohydrate ABC transporter permease [Streptomyces sp. NPDC053750]|uniref:carbohydrate ABC transporter permease n=1 Tax=Streptomyces sp. NPDC053750 TaxID=3365714 RepID=UPI0037D64DF9
MPEKAPIQASARPAERRRGMTENRFSSTMFLLPIVAIFITLFLIPLLQSVYFSFTDYNTLSGESNFIGLDNYVTVFTDASLLSGLGFTLLYAILTTVVTTALAIPLAVVLNKRFFGRTIARSLFFFVGVPSLAVLGLIWQYVFSPIGSGALNAVLGSFGVEPIPWLADATLARFCVIFVAVWAQVGWHATLYLAYLQTISVDLYEQASLDGAGNRSQFWHITLPELVPAIVVSTFLLLTNGLKVFDLPYAMTHGGPGFSTNTITQSIIVRGLSQSDYGLGSALAVLFTLGCVLVVMLQMAVANTATRRFS